MDSVVNEISNRKNMSHRELRTSANASNYFSAMLIEFQTGLDDDKDALSFPKNYELLLQSVARFSSVAD